MVLASGLRNRPWTCLKVFVQSPGKGCLGDPLAIWVVLDSPEAPISCIKRMQVDVRQAGCHSGTEGRGQYLSVVGLEPGRAETTLACCGGDCLAQCHIFL